MRYWIVEFYIDFTKSKKSINNKYCACFWCDQKEFAGLLDNLMHNFEGDVVDRIRIESYSTYEQADLIHHHNLMMGLSEVKLTSPQSPS